MLRVRRCPVVQVTAGPATWRQQEGPGPREASEMSSATRSSCSWRSRGGGAEALKSQVTAPGPPEGV